MTSTSKKLIGNHFFASTISKSRKDIRPAFLEIHTQVTQTEDWMKRSRKFMEKSRPDTTNWVRVA